MVKRILPLGHSVLDHFGGDVAKLMRHVDQLGQETLAAGVAAKIHTNVTLPILHPIIGVHFEEVSVKIRVHVFPLS